MKLTGIGKRFGSRTVLRDVSLEVLPASVTLLVGPNGAGKTTLLRIMAGLTRPSAGMVTRTFAAGKGGGADVGYLGHATFLYPGLSALENLAFWGGLHRRDIRRATLMDMLQRVELGRHAEERAGAFSRGMAQRLNLARILMLEPALLLLDEPGTGLDTRSLALLRTEIRRARDRGAGVVWISHDVAGDAAHADRLVAIAERRIAFDGAPPEYLARVEAAGAPGGAQGGATCPTSA